jgi:hypothetical protein
MQNPENIAGAREQALLQKTENTVASSSTPSL